MSSRGSSPVEDHGNMFAEPEDYYPPTPPPTTQEYTTHAGATITLHLVGFSPTEAHHLWNGARVLADYFETHPGTVRAKTVLELGAGAGLPSLVAGMLGAAKVVMTDYPDRDIVDVMQKNVDGCALLPPPPPPPPPTITGGGSGVVVAKGYIWGHAAAPLLAELPRPDAGFDVVVLADLLFRHTEHGHLLDTIRDTLARRAGSRAFVFFTSYRPWLRHKDLAFFALARERGFVVEQVLERVLERPMFEDDPGDEEVRKTCTGWVVRWPAEACVEGDLDTE